MPGSENENLELTFALSLDNQRLQQTLREAEGTIDSACRQIQAELDNDPIQLDSSKMQQSAREITDALQNVRGAADSVSGNLEKVLGSLGVDIPAAGQFGELAGGLGEIGTAAGSAAPALTAVGAAVGGLAVVGAVVVGITTLSQKLIDLSKAGIDAEAGVYSAADKLGASFDTVKRMETMFAAAGVELSEGASGLSALNTALMSTSEEGEQARQALQQFGVSLTNSDGSLLTYEEELDQVAIAYNRAKEAGAEAAFATATQTEALVPLLENYDKIKEMAENVVFPELLPPETARELQVEIAIMEKQFENLKTALSEALGPMAAELVPALTNLFADLVQLINDNADGINTLSQVAGRFLAAVINIGDVFVKMAQVACEAIDAIGEKLAWIGEKYDAFANKVGEFSPTAGDFLKNPLDLREDLNFDYDKSKEKKPRDINWLEKALAEYQLSGEKAKDEERAAQEQERLRRAQEREQDRQQREADRAAAAQQRREEQEANRQARAQEKAAREQERAQKAAERKSTGVSGGREREASSLMSSAGSVTSALGSLGDGLVYSERLYAFQTITKALKEYLEAAANSENTAPILEEIAKNTGILAQFVTGQSAAEHRIRRNPQDTARNEVPVQQTKSPELDIASLLSTFASYVPTVETPQPAPVVYSPPEMPNIEAINRIDGNVQRIVDNVQAEKHDQDLPSQPEPPTPEQSSNVRTKLPIPERRMTEQYRPSEKQTEIVPTVLEPYPRKRYEEDLNRILLGQRRLEQNQPEPDRRIRERREIFPELPAVKQVPPEQPIKETGLLSADQYRKELERLRQDLNQLGKKLEPKKENPLKEPQRKSEPEPEKRILPEQPQKAPAPEQQAKKESLPKEPRKESEQRTEDLKALEYLQRKPEALIVTIPDKEKPTEESAQPITAKPPVERREEPQDGLSLDQYRKELERLHLKQYEKDLEHQPTELQLPEHPDKTEEPLAVPLTLPEVPKKDAEQSTIKQPPQEKKDESQERLSLDQYKRELEQLHLKQLGQELEQQGPKPSASETPEKKPEPSVVLQAPLPEQSREERQSSIKQPPQELSETKSEQYNPIIQHLREIERLLSHQQPESQDQSNTEHQLPEWPEAESKAQTAQRGTTEQNKLEPEVKVVQQVLPELERPDEKSGRSDIKQSPTEQASRIPEQLHTEQDREELVLLKQASAISSSVGQYIQELNKRQPAQDTRDSQASDLPQVILRLPADTPEHREPLEYKPQPEHREPLERNPQPEMIPKLRKLLTQYDNRISEPETVQSEDSSGRQTTLLPQSDGILSTLGSIDANVMTIASTLAEPIMGVSEQSSTEKSILPDTVSGENEETPNWNSVFSNMTWPQLPEQLVRQTLDTTYLANAVQALSQQRQQDQQSQQRVDRTAQRSDTPQQNTQPVNLTVNYNDAYVDSAARQNEVAEKTAEIIMRNMPSTSSVRNTF